MRREIVRTSSLILTLGLLVCCPQPAGAVITRLTPLKAVLESEKLIFVAKVETLEPDKPAMTLGVDEPLKGKPPFGKLPVSLTGDREGKKEKHPALLAKRLAPGLPLVIFASPNGPGTRYTAFGYTNGTWFQMIGHVEKGTPASVRWELTHCEPYLRRTFKGTTAELRQVVRDGLDGKKAPPEPDPKESPGLGPEVKSEKPKQNKGGLPATGGPVLAVIPSFALFGPLALLAALFPAVFGGLSLVLRRWAVLLAVAGLSSTVYFLHHWFRGSIQGFWWGTPLGLWASMTGLALVGAIGSWGRYRNRPPDEREVALQPRRIELLLLGAASLLGVVIVLACLWHHALGRPPWNESLVIWVVAWVGVLYLLYLRLTPGRRPPLPTEVVLLGTMAFACAGFGATLLPRYRAAGVDMAWAFEPIDRGTILSAPLVANGKVYVAAAHSAGLRSFGRLYCVHRITGEPLWTFDNGEDMKPVSISSPCLADGSLYIGEGFHQDSGCRLYCLDAETGTKRWDFETGSHVESSPCVAGGRVYFGAGDDGVYCLDARTGEKRWNFGGVHVDVSPAVAGDCLFAGTGYGRAYEAFCLNAATGEAVWRVKVDLPVWGSPAVADGRVFLGLGNGDLENRAERPAGALLCLRADTGAEVWRWDVAAAVFARPAVDATRGRVYFGARDHSVYGVDIRDGKPLWQRDLGSPVVAAPTLIEDRLYVAAADGRVCCLQGETGSPLWEFDLAQSTHQAPRLFSAPAVRKGRVYFGSEMKNVSGSQAALYCLKEQ